MAIKWNITAKATEARGHMDAISRAYDKLNANARGHRSDVEGLATQVHDMQGDLESAANVMGNGGEHSEESPEVAPKPGHVSADPPVLAGDGRTFQRIG